VPKLSTTPSCGSSDEKLEAPVCLLCPVSVTRVFVLWRCCSCTVWTLLSPTESLFSGGVAPYTMDARSPPLDSPPRIGVPGSFGGVDAQSPGPVCSAPSQFSATSVASLLLTANFAQFEPDPSKLLLSQLEFAGAPDSVPSLRTLVHSRVCVPGACVPPLSTLMCITCVRGIVSPHSTRGQYWPRGVVFRPRHSHGMFSFPLFRPSHGTLSPCSFLAESVSSPCHLAPLSSLCGDIEIF